MSALTDALVAIGVVVVFGYLIFMRLKKKFPGLGERMDEYFPYLKSNKPVNIKQMEESKQRWTERREIM